MKKIIIILSILLIGYYFIATFLCIILQSLNPVINPNYYNYYIRTSNLKEKFPNKNLWVWTGFLFDRDLQNSQENQGFP